MTEPWLNYLYHYGVGGIAFCSAMFFLFRSGAIKLERSGDRKLVFALAGGLGTYMVVHALWILLATS